MALKLKKKYILIGVFSICLSFIYIIFDYAQYDNMEYLDMCFELKSSVNSKAALYYDFGKGYSEANSSKIYIRRSDVFHEYCFQLPHRRIFNNIRLDPLNEEGVFSIRNIRITNSNDKIIKELLLSKIKPLNQISSLNFNEDCNCLIGKTINGAKDPMLDLSTTFKLNNKKKINVYYLENKKRIFKTLLVLSILIFLTINLSYSKNS